MHSREVQSQGEVCWGTDCSLNGGTSQKRTPFGRRLDPQVLAPLMWMSTPRIVQKSSEKCLECLRVPCKPGLREAGNDSDWWSSVPPGLCRGRLHASLRRARAARGQGTWPRRRTAAPSIRRSAPAWHDTAITILTASRTVTLCQGTLFLYV